jgi:hypothetical protein
MKKRLFPRVGNRYDQRTSFDVHICEPPGRFLASQRIIRDANADGDKLDYIARLCRFSLYINAPEDKGLSALYRLMRPIFSLFRFQCIQSCDDSKFLTSVFKYTRESVNFYVKRFYNSLKTQYEVMSDYVNSEYADTKESFFQYVYQLLDYNGYSFLNNPLLQFSQTESIIQSQRLIKHKKLNDYNKLLINQLNT